MTVVNRGASGAWHIFHGEEARVFIAGLVMVADWPVEIYHQHMVRQRGQLFATEHGTFVLVIENANIPEFMLMRMFTEAVIRANEELRRKHAAN